MSPILPTQNDHPGDASEDEVGAGDTPQPVLTNGDSDSGSYSDEEGPSHDGYELLSQDPDNLLNFSENDNLEIPGILSHGVEGGEITTGTVIRSLFPEASNISAETEAKSSTETPLTTESERKGYSMDEEHIEKIKAAMKGFTLPSCNVPAWASVVPEEEWKTEILTFLESRVPPRSGITSSSSKSKCDSPCTSREADKSKADNASQN